jgi:hypothetical protein
LLCFVAADLCLRSSAWAALILRSVASTGRAYP